MNIREFNAKHKKFKIKYDPDTNMYSLDGIVEEFHYQPLEYFKWNINGIKAIDGHNTIPLSVFDDFIEVYKSTRQLDIMIPIPLFFIDNHRKERELDEESIEKMLVEFGYDSNDIYIEQQEFKDTKTTDVRIHINRDKDLNALRLFLECMFNAPKNSMDIISWDIYDADDITRPFIYIEYAHTW